VWDDRGRRLVDWICGYGPIVLGHSDTRVANAVYRQLLQGTLLPGDSVIESALAERLVTLFPGADTCVFLKTGSEAVAAAVRFARIATGRSQVLRVGFHGWHDGLIDGKVGWHNWDNARSSSPPVPGTLAHGYEIGMGRVAADIEYRVRLPEGQQLAALVLDPIQVPDPERDLPRLRAACTDTGTVFILDETKTAFRVALGGVQARHRVRADITVAGKALANGLPLAGVLGPAELICPKRARVKGTFSAERGAIAAAHATLDVLEKEDVCAHLSAIGSALIDSINEALRGTVAGGLVRAVPYRWNCMPHLHANSYDVQAQECRRALVADVMTYGALLLEKHNSFVNAAHNVDDVETTANAFRQALERSIYG
jgi:glutamate-1-semialdehyde aminotransferase